MQTFLPYKDFKASAEVLDNRRLGKQRVECLQILKAINQGPVCKYNFADKKYVYGNLVLAKNEKLRVTPFYNHTATQLWINTPAILIVYGTAICNEWTRRGFNDTCTEKIAQYSSIFSFCQEPKWLGDERLHSSHRAALLAKDNKWYSQFNWKEKPEINYFWAKSA